MTSPLPYIQGSKHASRSTVDQPAESRHHDFQAQERAVSPDDASDAEQQAESTRKLIQVYSVTAPVREKKKKERAGKYWKTGNKRVDDLLYEPSTRRLRALRYRTRALWLLALYIPLMVVPWILTCILSRRPVTALSYVNQQGFSKADMASIRNWKRTIDVLNSIHGLITIPLLSALLAQGAVVFSQRQRPDQFLSLPDLFALVDRGWTSIPALWGALKMRENKEHGQKLILARHYLLPGAALILLGAIQQPLFQILVPVETIYVATCGDLTFMPHCKNQKKVWYPTDGEAPRYETVGVDIEPAQMAGILYEDILPRISADLASVSVDEYQPSLWSDYTTKGLRGYLEYDHTTSTSTPLRDWIFPPMMSTVNGNPFGSRFFVAGIPSNTTTGVLREHAMRFNSSVECKAIERTSFPSPCPGEEPFTASSEKENDISVRVCVPGKLGVFPWTLSRNRQDITEELYLDFWDTYRYRAGERETSANATVRCVMNTTRGYFELGNARNNGTYGPLLEKWPDANAMARDFNDITLDFVPTESDDYVGDSLGPGPDSRRPQAYWKPSGPLALSAVALFGNISWFSSIARSSANIIRDYENKTITSDETSWYRQCAGMPFAALSGPYNVWYFRASSSCRTLMSDQMFIGATNRTFSLLDVRYRWITQFAPYKNDMRLLPAILQISAFTTNRALLNHFAPTVNGQPLGAGNFRGRNVYTSPGYPVLKPTLSIGVLVAMSLLIGLQLLGLLCLTWYIYHVPSWTGALDAMAMAHIGARLGQQNVLLDGVSGDRDRDARTLQKVNGLIEVVHIEEERDESGTEMQWLRRNSLDQQDGQSR